MKQAAAGVTITNPDKVMYPAVGFTKADVVAYYLAVARYLLPYLKNRPVTLKRYPDGVRGEFFYEKDAPAFTPKWVETFPVPRRHGGRDIRYILINDRRTLAWCANIASLELHPFLHRVPDLESPTAVVFDFDPGESADVLTCARVAFLVKDVLDRLELASVVKVSGSKGLQLYVPLNSQAKYAVTQPFARTVAELLEREHADLVTAEMAKSERQGRVFIDWSQNATHKTTVAVYSLRAKRSRPFVSMPVTWEELRTALDRNAADRLFFEPKAALERLQRLGDLFRPVLTRKQRLPTRFVDQLRPASPRRSARRSKPARDDRSKPARDDRSKPAREERSTPAPEERAGPGTLEAYRAKRDFARTPEPAPGRVRPSSQGSRRRFVIQKHAASRLHYDFRLEMHGVLKSWAVPKGPPYALTERRLAMATEDHPLEYLQFEGTIPQGQYGGGTVMVWDIGTYEIIDGSYHAGKLHLFLEGKKLRGEWTLVRTPDGEDKKWLLIKTGAALEAISARDDDASALTGRTMARIAEDNDAQWQSNREAKVPARRLEPPQPMPETDVAGLPKSELRFVEPMKAKLVATLPEGDDWIYEIKFDGYRVLAVKTKREVRLLSRNDNLLNPRFPRIAEALQALAPDTIVDGEIVALDDRGRPSFNLLQHARSTTTIVYYAFDILAYRGKDVRALPLAERRPLLTAALAPTRDPIRLSQTFTARAGDLMAAAREQELEGLVAKRLSSVYEPGKRSGAWMKVKLHGGQELVIGGYVPGKDHFDALLVGYYEGDRLLFLAKVRNGFVPEVKRQVFERFRGLETDVCPFANLPEPKGVRRGMALTREAMKQCRWLQPKLVAEIAFADWTAGNHLRHARFVGLRDDKDPREVVREAA